MGWLKTAFNRTPALFEGGMAAAVFTLLVSIWFSNGDPVIVGGAMLLAVVIGCLAISVLPGAKLRKKIGLCTLLTIVAGVDGGFIYFHAHPSSQPAISAAIPIKTSLAPPLELTAARMEGDYSEGNTIYGIKWKGIYSELLVVLASKNYDYTNLDIRLVSDAAIEELGTDYPLGPDCTAAHNPLPPLNLPHFKTKNGKTFQIPLPTTGGRIWRVHCTQILSDSKLQIIGATAPPLESPGLPKRFPKKQMASWVVGRITGPRNFLQYFHACLADSCSDMPSPQDVDWNSIAGIRLERFYVDPNGNAVVK